MPWTKKTQVDDTYQALDRHLQAVKTCNRADFMYAWKERNRRIPGSQRMQPRKQYARPWRVKTMEGPDEDSLIETDSEDDVSPLFNESRLDAYYKLRNRTDVSACCEWMNMVRRQNGCKISPLEMDVTNGIMMLETLYILVPELFPKDCEPTKLERALYERNMSADESNANANYDPASPPASRPNSTNMAVGDDTTVLENIDVAKACGVDKDLDIEGKVMKKNLRLLVRTMEKFVWYDFYGTGESLGQMDYFGLDPWLLPYFVLAMGHHGNNRDKSLRAINELEEEEEEDYVLHYLKNAMKKAFHGFATAVPEKFTDVPNPRNNPNDPLDPNYEDVDDVGVDEIQPVAPDVEQRKAKSKQSKNTPGFANAFSEKYPDVPNTRNVRNDQLEPNYEEADDVVADEPEHVSSDVELRKAKSAVEKATAVRKTAPHGSRVSKPKSKDSGNDEDSVSVSFDTNEKRAGVRYDGMGSISVDGKSVASEPETSRTVSISSMLSTERNTKTSSLSSREPSSRSRRMSANKSKLESIEGELEKVIEELAEEQELRIKCEAAIKLLETESELRQRHSAKMQILVEKMTQSKEEVFGENRRLFKLLHEMKDRELALLKRIGETENCAEEEEEKFKQRILELENENLSLERDLVEVRDELEMTTDELEEKEEEVVETREKLEETRRKLEVATKRIEVVGNVEEVLKETKNVVVVTTRQLEETRSEVEKLKRELEEVKMGREEERRFGRPVARSSTMLPRHSLTSLLPASDELTSSPIRKSSKLMVGREQTIVIRRERNEYKRLAADSARLKPSSLRAKR